MKTIFSECIVDLPKALWVYANIEGMIEFAQDGIVSKTVLKAPDKEVSLFCMSTGQMLSSHTSSYPAIIHVLRGKGEITLAKKKYEASTNAWFYMPANLPHALLSTDNLVFLLTLFKGTE
jgi:quercetin dioxygenase-like cupin family protein